MGSASLPKVNFNSIVHPFIILFYGDKINCKPAKGAFPGEYSVLVMEGARKPLGGPDASLLAPGAMDSKYSDPRTTTLKATVVAGPNNIKLEVERAPKE